MSYQPQVPPTFQAAQPLPPAVPPPKRKRHKGLILFGLIVLIVGVLGGGAMVAKSMSNYKTAVKALARAPVGCTTTLVFDKPATFTIYLETKGKLGTLGGDCASNGASYDHTSGTAPKVVLTLVDSSGKAIDLPRGATASYNVAGYIGSGYRTLKIANAGDYRLKVESDESDFSVAIGKNPKEDSDLLKTIGGSVALGGLVLGLTFLLLGLRHRRPDVAPVAAHVPPAGPITPWGPSPYAQAPTGPPTPPKHPGYRVEPPPPPQPYGVPTAPPIRQPDQPAGTGFAPPSLVPPPPPPSPVPQPPPSTGGWSVPEDDDS